MAAESTSKFIVIIAIAIAVDGAEEDEVHEGSQGRKTGCYNLSRASMGSMKEGSLRTADDSYMAFYTCPDLNVDEVPGNIWRNQVKMDDEGIPSDGDTDNAVMLSIDQLEGDREKIPTRMAYNIPSMKTLLNASF
ncbi:MAG: hypothetical protein Q9169_002815 [Polycauliona sp. 2 TL-2023]